jgi:hypothetical protein
MNEERIAFTFCAEISKQNKCHRESAFFRAEMMIREAATVVRRHNRTSLFLLALRLHEPEHLLQPRSVRIALRRSRFQHGNAAAERWLQEMP